MATLTHPVHFISGGKTFEIVSGEGVERCSAPWKFELVFHEPSGEDVDLAKLLKDPAELVWKAPVSKSGDSISYRTAHFRGFLAAAHTTEDGNYQVTLAPRLWKLSLQKNTRIFMEKTVQEILEEILKEHGFGSNEYAINCAKGPKREFVVQYQESDLDFIDRWLQHEGIAYYFKETDDAEQVVFFDSTAAYVPVPGSAEVSAGAFRDDASKLAIDGWGGDQLVFNFAMDINMLPAKVVMKDYNWRKPSEDLKVEKPVSPDGAGIVYIYGDHFKEKAEGEALAKVRVEELTCREKIGRGYGTHKSFRPGHTFKLKDHEKASLNAEYLLVDVEHRVSQEVGEGRTGTLYANRFHCIPSSATFRPERATEWPSVHGFMHGKIDAGGDGKYAEIDDMGRYKVQLPFDLSGKSGGKASRYVRMMQPYAGGGMGMHFPLHRGTEVLLAFLDGDPDRPIIIGAVPNPETASPVSGGNQTQCKIQTGGGTKLTIEDTDGSQQMKMETPTEGSFFTMGAANSPPGFNFGSAAHMNRELGGNELLKAAGDQLANIAGSTNHMTGGSHKTTVGGSKKTFVAGSNTTVVGGSDKTIVGGACKLTVGASRTVKASASIKHQAGASHQVKAGAGVKSQSGAATNIKAGAALKMQSGAATSIKAGAAVKSQSGAATNIKAGGPIKMQSGGPTNIKAGGPINAQGASINIKGPTNIKGATKIKGETKIKGATKIDGATTIKGATKIKGATQITGNTKINGNNLNVT